jgi:Ca-activated chloride channel family protein
MAAKSSFYDLLGLPQDATPGELRQAYHDAALLYHPDVNSSQEATERFIEIQEAYETLSNPQSRKEYDRELAENDPNPIRLEVLYSTPSLMYLDEPQLLYVMLNGAPSKNYRPAISPPINICLVLDRSTSMQGPRMDAVKDAAIGLLRSMEPSDQVAIVTFSDRAEVLAGAGSLNHPARIEAQIQMIHASGGTEIFQGLETGLGEIRRFATHSRVNHIILITDGRTYGDEEACLQLAEHCGNQGIQITGMGLGAEWNDEFMDQLTSLTGGTSYFVSSNQELRRLVVDKINHLKTTFADHLRLRVTPAPGVRLVSLYRVSPDPAIIPVDQAIRLGSLPHQSALSALLELQVEPFPHGDERLQIARVVLEYELPSETGSAHRQELRLSRLASSEPSLELPPTPIYQALAKLNLYRMQERARQDVAHGKVKEAGDRLQRLATELLRRGEIELAHTAIVEAERIQQTQMISAEGEKQIKYGTRALLPASTSTVTG